MWPLVQQVNKLVNAGELADFDSIHSKRVGHPRQTSTGHSPARISWHYNHTSRRYLESRWGRRRHLPVAARVLVLRHLDHRIGPWLEESTLYPPMVGYDLPELWSHHRAYPDWRCLEKQRNQGCVLGSDSDFGGDLVVGRSADYQSCMAG